MEIKKTIELLNGTFFDNKLTEENMYDFYTLGFDEYITISAEHNIGINKYFQVLKKSEAIETTSFHT